MVVRKTSLRVLSVYVLSNQQSKLQEVQRKIYGSVVIHAGVGFMPDAEVSQPISITK